MRRVVLAGTLGLIAALFCGFPAPAQDNTTRAASFAKDVLPVLKTSCSKCHAGANAKAKIDLSSYDAVKKGGKSGPVVVEGAPDKSSLVSSISGDKPDMPKNAKPLTKAQVLAISAWIKEGAKNN
jgi:mono/diheme cytochrome c family protein